MLLVDTSVWIPYLGHGRGSICDAVDQLISDGEILAITPVILQEVLQGARSRQQFRRLEKLMAAQAILFPANLVQCHIRAAELYFRCRSAGVTIRSSNDCLIALIAIEHRVPLLHNDRDFDHIGRVDQRLILA